ncbi:MAG: DUF2917 domain-containing protein [Burkholderiales bacterium]|nr:DUF2917 domain-containing protein [Burkholderiales bacterium]
MNSNDLNLASTALRKGEVLHLHHALGQRIEALDGRLWITMDGDLRDVVINAGEGFTVDRGSDVLLSAMSDAQLIVLLPTAATA